MDKGKIDKLLEDISYLRGRFDTIIPEMQKSSSNINTILQLHKEEIDKIKDQQLVFKTKVGVYGGLAAGMVYMTTGSGSAPLNAAGILMIKQ